MSHFLVQVTITTLLLTFLVLAPTTTAIDVAVDTDGDPLIAGAYYNAMPIANQKGGGLTMFNNGSKMCPTFIVALSNKGNMDLNAIPLKFSPQNIVRNQNIYVSSSVSITFKFLTPQPLCRRMYTKVWAVSSENVIVLDGQEGMDYSSFTLEAYGGGYKIKANKKTVLYEKKASGEILLGLDHGKPLLVVFVKA